jgi:hypothetical protein
MRRIDDLTCSVRDSEVNGLDYPVGVHHRLIEFEARCKISVFPRGIQGAKSMPESVEVLPHGLLEYRRTSRRTSVLSSVRDHKASLLSSLPSGLEGMPDRIKYDIGNK